MSIDELLKNSKDPAWSRQRQKLVKVVFFLGIVAFALTIAAIVMSLEKKQNRDSESLAQLMSVRKEAEDLQKEIDELKATSTTTNGRVRTTSTRTSRADQQIINFDPGEGFMRVIPDSSDIYIPTGAVFLAQLITPIKTSVERTFVMAEVTNDFRMDMKRKIVKGSRLIGRSRLNPVLKGVIVEFELLVSPEGIESNLNALALSKNALPEIDGLYFSNELETYGTALAFGFLSGFASAAREREMTLYGSIPEVSVTNQVLTGISTASFQVAEDILRDIRNRSVEYVIVPAGERIFVALTSRYVVEQRNPVIPGNPGGSQ